MSVKITNNTGAFDLPVDFNIEIEDTSPIYNERGSQSVAATLPASKNNLCLTGHIDRTDIDNAPVTDASVIVSDGAYRRIGKMNITKASHADGIVANIGFDESEIYNIWNSVSLRSLEGLPVYRPEGGTKDILAYMGDILLERRTDTPFHVFQICVAMPGKTENDLTVYYPELLNETTKNNDTLQYYLDGDARTKTLLIDNELVQTSFPICYGITPFLKVSWMLDTLFSLYGYRVVENPFTSHPQLSRLVVLNNAADCCVKGYIDYADLMPECTICEFLQALYCRFGMVYFVNGKDKTVKLKFIKDIVTAPASQDWSVLKASAPVINYNAPQQLRLSAATAIAGPTKDLIAAPIAESLDKFLKPYNYIVSTKEHGYLNCNKSSGVYYFIKPYTKTDEGITSDFFPWDRGANIAYQEITSIDESVPMSRYSKNGIVCPAYLFGKVHRYTNIASADVELPDSQESKTPLAFCFGMPVSSHNYPYGSVRCVTPLKKPIVDKDGNTFDISITFVGENGLFNRFWKEYDAILRHANHTIEEELHLNHDQLLNADFSQTIGQNGQRLLIDNFRYTLPLQVSKPTTVNFRTLKLLKPYDLEKEQKVPVIEQEYIWVLYEDRQEMTGHATREQVQNWRALIRPPDQWVGLNWKNEVIDPISDAEFPFTVPTKDDYDNHRRHYIKKANYSFDLSYNYLEFVRLSAAGLPVYNNKTGGHAHYDVKFNVEIRADKL